MAILLNGVLEFALAVIKIPQLIVGIPGIRAQRGGFLESGFRIRNPPGVFIGAGQAIERYCVARVDIQSTLKLLQRKVVLPR